MLRIASVPFTRSSKRHAPVDLSAAQIGANEKGAPFSSKRTWVLMRCLVSRRRTKMKVGYTHDDPQFHFSQTICAAKGTCFEERQFREGLGGPVAG